MHMIKKRHEIDVIRFTRSTVMYQSWLGPIKTWKRLRRALKPPYKALGHLTKKAKQGWVAKTDYHNVLTSITLLNHGLTS